MADESRALAKYAAELSYDQIPPKVRTLAIDLLVNTIGCEIGGSALPWAKSVHQAYRNTGNLPEATVTCYGDRLPVASAAFINATFSHAFEYDDGTPPYHGHPGSEIIPALMAVAEREHVGGRELLTTLVAAYELRGRVGWAVSPEMSRHGAPHYSSGCGGFGAAMGVARLLGMDFEGIHNAIGIAGSFSGGLMQYDQGGGSVKRVVCAIAASSGIQSAFLAQSGITGPEGIFEGKRGLLRMFSTQFRHERLTAEFGKLWTIEQTLFKAYSCCGIIHAAIDAMKGIVTEHHLKAGDIASVDVGYPSGLHDHVGITAPHDLAGAQFSTSYSLALTVLKGGNSPVEYKTEILDDPQIRDFASRIRVYEDVELNKLCEGRGRFPARVKVRTRAGGQHEMLVPDAKGSAEVPLTSAEIDAKFSLQAADIMGKKQADRVLSALRSIESLDDTAKLAPMLVVNGK
jgi:2-methylcitrate dehydratase PrpD